MEPIHGQIPLESLPIAEGAFVGMNLKIERASAPALQQLLDQGYHYIEWDGRREVLDGQGRVIAVLAGQPEDPSWSKVIEQANAAMRTARSKCTIDAAHHVHRRGVFATLARGFSFGGGRKVPGPIVNSPQNEDALAELCQSSAMKRLAGYGHSMLASYAPAIFANMRTQLKALAEHHPSLPPFNFQNSTYPAASFNFGPSAVCFIHTDAANDPCNMCHIVALGEYNPDTSGHIVFPDLMLVVRFPPGASILIPSAILRHGNTPIQPGEERMSFTQYCAGGLMRWVECGFRTVAAFRTEDPDAYAMYQAGLKHRADRCCQMFAQHL
ncbi:hypothetical protein C8Q78DRAFT_1072795 [Trametes maxima]|nr:hypothetical protein C8Q78DRAFT_1072795 [Trametes maxima]